MKPAPHVKSMGNLYSYILILKVVIEKVSLLLQKKKY